MMMHLTPYITTGGNAEEILNFYKDAFDGDIAMLSRYADSPMPVDEDWKNKIIHARLKFGDNLLMISDGPKDYKAVSSENIQLSIEIDDVSKMEKIFNKLAEGGKIRLPLGKQFWGATFGMLVDKFGINWMLNHEEKK